MAARSLNRSQLARLFRGAELAAGPRYTREANVDVPIRNAFEALLREPSFFARFDELARDMERSRGYLLEETKRFREVANVAPRLRGLALRSDRLAKALRNIQRDPVVDLPLAAIARTARRLEADAETLTNRLYEDLRQVPDGEAAPPRKKLLEEIATRVNSIRSAAGGVASFSGSRYARVTNLGTLLLVGEAGQGKTHLFCEVVRRALEDERPAILLMGQHFRSTDDLWKQIATQIGVTGLGGRGALSTLERLGRQKRRRAILMIDALNEAGGLDLWPRALEDLIQTARRHPHLVIALSCRSSYVRAVIPQRIERTVTRFEHEGFSGVEADATARFFSHYGLRHPAIPLLSPEFSRPLFLKLFCEGLQDRRSKVAPSGHRGMTDVMENFARSVGRRIVRKMRHPELTMLPWRCLKELASHMAQQGVEAIDRPQAEAVVVGFVEGKVNGLELLQNMVDEGLLAEDVRYDDNSKPIPVVRFPYQQFSDHLIARYLLHHHLDRQTPRRSFASGGPLHRLIGDRFVPWRYSGLLPALAIQIPEWTNFELLELVPSRARDALFGAHIQSIVWRRPDRFLDVPKVIRFLNDAARSSESLLHEAWDAMLTVAAISNHPLNAHRLHTSLWAPPLATRDSTWSLYLHRSWGPGSVVDRYLQWSDSVDAKSLPDDVLLLAAIALTWFLTTSNRFIRDRSTKALVRVMRGRFTVLSSLIDQFRGVNDQYVTERLLCAAYGCALSSADGMALEALARKVHTDFLTGQNRQRHILIRDYAEGIVTRAKALSPSLQLKTVKTRWRGIPLRPPTRERLAAQYEHDRNYSDIWHSVLGQDDFDRYVIEPALRHFTGYRLSERIAPKQREEVQSGPTLFDVLGRQMAGEDAGAEEQILAQQPRRPVPPRDPKERFDIDVARRWIFARVLSLGWTPERFFEFDRMVNYRDVREARKPERIGKKYQWIGFHEALGVLADNYRWHPEFGYEGAGQCPGGWAMGVRDIDPSHLPISRPTSGRRPWWQSLRYSLTPVASTALEPWIRSRYWPDPKPLIRPTDPDGNEWITTEGYYEWGDVDASRSGEDRYPYRSVWYQLRCYLVRNSQAGRMRRWLHKQDFMGRWMPESVSHHGDFIAEYPWHPSARGARQGWTRGWRGDRRPPVAVLTSAASLAWDDSFDASIEGSYSGMVPAAWLVPELQASWQPPFDYTTSSGRVVATDPSWHVPGPRVGLVRRRDFDHVCRTLGVVPFWTLLGEKQVIEGSARATLPWREVSGAFEIKDGTVVGSTRQKLGFARTQSSN